MSLVMILLNKSLFEGQVKRYDMISVSYMVSFQYLITQHYMIVFFWITMILLRSSTAM